MLFINSQNTDPFINLAAEEYLLKKKEEDIFMLWISTPSVVIGKHQNAFAEINYDFIKKNGIDVARRLSGGGTVYHDEGNLNFTWIKNGEPGKLVDFKKFINPVIDFLKTININAVFGERNEILVNNCKISGNAEHIFKNRTLHHGTLLFETNLDKLRKSLSVNDKKYYDKAVKSVPHKVTNIKEFLDKNIKINQFRTNLFDYIRNVNNSGSVYEFNASEIRTIENLKNQKFKQWDWIFGYSPDYTFKRKIKINKEETIIEFKVHKGTISNVTCKNLKNSDLKHIIKSTLEDNTHREDSILENFYNNLKEYNNHFNCKVFTTMLF